jgi:putative DNA primase/helicase
MMQSFEHFVRSLGLIPKNVSPDGKWHRCGTETNPKSLNGAYKLTQDGRLGWAQDWSSMDSPASWTVSKAEAPNFRPEDLHKAREEEAAIVAAAIRDAKDYYALCKPLRGGHPYLESHGLNMAGCYGLRVGKDGWLVIPSYLEPGNLRTIQRIAPDGTKRFWAGAPLGGSTYRITRDYSTVTIICEGLATGLACFAAVPDSQVIVAWNAGNLKLVKGISGMAVIAADNDHGTEQRIGVNPGRQKAEEAAKALGIGIAWPDNIQGTDWADYRKERREQISQSSTSKFATDGVISRRVDQEIARLLLSKAQFV